MFGDPVERLRCEPGLSMALQRERDASVVDGVLRHDVGHARELVGAGLEHLNIRKLPGWDTFTCLTIQSGIS